MRGAVSKLWDKLWGSRSDAWLDASPSSEARDCRPPGIAGKWLRRLLAGVVLLAVAFASAYAVYRWQQPRWPGLPAEPELLASIAWGQELYGVYDNYFCVGKEPCVFSQDCVDPNTQDGAPCGSCQGRKDGLCVQDPQKNSGYRCVQYRRACCQVDKACQTRAAGWGCFPVPYMITVGTWWECYVAAFPVAN